MMKTKMGKTSLSKLKYSNIDFFSRSNDYYKEDFLQVFPNTVITVIEVKEESNNSEKL